MLLDFFGELGAFGGCCVRADQHSVAARFVGRLDDQFIRQMFEHTYVELLWFSANVGRDVRQNDFLVEIIFHDLRDVGVNDLVIGDARAGCIGESDIPGLMDFHQAGHAEHVESETESFGIQKIIIHAAVNNIHAFEAIRRAHPEDKTVRDDQRSLPLTTNSTPICCARNECSK